MERHARVVTLAAALALPSGDAPFPHRDIIVFCAFSVVLTTLVAQGLTLRPLMTRLHLERDETVDREVRLARQTAAQAALDVLQQHRGDSFAVQTLQQEFEQLRVVDDHAAEPSGQTTGLRRALVVAQRTALADLRARHVIGAAAFIPSRRSLTSSSWGWTRRRTHADSDDVATRLARPRVVRQTTLSLLLRGRE